MKKLFARRMRCGRRENCPILQSHVRLRTAAEPKAGRSIRFGIHGRGRGIWLWMASDRKDGDDRYTLLPLDLVRTTVPEDSVRAGRIVLGIGLKDLFPVSARKRGELVRLEPWMVRVNFEES